MRERVEGLGGRLERLAETGTSLRITLPLRQAPFLAEKADQTLKERPA